MSLLVLLLIPSLGVAFMFVCRQPRHATWAALFTGVLEVLAIVHAVWRIRSAGVLQAGRYLRADGLTAFFLINIGFIFALVLVYSVGYMRHIPAGRFSSPRWFYGMFFLFLFTMIAVYLSANLGMLWICVEATTLASALLVGFYNTERAVSQESALDWATLMTAAATFGPARDLVKLSFVFVAVGYGTKIGFVPMHSWLPDAHAEAPSPISALLSAVMLNCAMYALLRFDAIISHAIGSGFSHTLLLAFGGLSVAVAALLMIVQKDLKRLLAYSSIEHMGLVAIGVGLGGTLGLFAALLHAFNHSVAKALMFFVAGDVRENFGTLRMKGIRGMARSLPWTSAGLVLGSLAIVGMPPFGLFISEFMILTAAFRSSRYVIAILVLASLSVVFGALLHHFQHMLGGKPGKAPVKLKLLPAEFAVMGICSVFLIVFGLHIPGAFANLVQRALAVLQ